MRLTAGSMLAVLALAAPALAQTEARETKAKPNTEKLWLIEATGIGGWGAASQAKRIGSILDKHPSISNLIFDTTGVGYFKLRGKKAPDTKALDDLLQKKRAGKGIAIKTLKEVDVEKAKVVYEVQISGLGWMSTAIETRDVLSKLDGVIRVHPNGLNGKAKVFVRDYKKSDSKDMETAMETTKDLRVRKIKRTRA